MLIVIMATKNQDRTLYTKYVMYAVVVALVLGTLFLKSYFSIIAVSILFAFIYFPVYKWLNKKYSPSAAASLTLVINILSLVIPLILITIITVKQAEVIADDVGEMFVGQSATELMQSILDPINRAIENFTGNPETITTNDVFSKLSEYAASFANFILSTVTGWVGSLGSLITNVILYIYIFMAVLKHNKKLTDIFKSLNPLGDKVTNLYFEKAGAMTKGMVKGQFTIAVAQGVTSAIILTIAGLPYGAFFALILSFMSLIPLGAGIITLPIGFVKILLGDWWQGLLIILGHLLIVTNIDNVLRPMLVPKKAFMNPALLLLSVFAGIAAFGFLGIVLGPVLMILIVTTLDIYMNTKTPKPSAKK